jgi:hypothetical protein
MTDKLNGHSLIGPWMQTAKPGDVFIYFTSSRDRQLAQLEFKQLREEAMDLSDNGRIFLTQRKLAIDVYEYRATRREDLPEPKLKPTPPKLAKVKWL